ncbi:MULTISPECIES: YusW family protein [Solibacillus]|uniref:YusW-like protein n=1 Tax=Solibacillus merdavium TaxID=2762218 RepID=A0ABR8XQ63_9BACL|nr:YusW family protein [Solibacillus merdavium]MBD8034029.1 hypothetical protein [Solibacillus merdavium]
MKKIALFLAIGTSAFLVACGDKEEATNLPDNAPTEQNTMDQTSKVTETTDAPYNFTHFDLDIKYADNKSYEVDYENEASRAEASIHDEVNNSKIEGNEATNTLVPIFESFTFDANTDSDAVIDEVLEKFNQPDSFLEVEIEIKYADGTVKEYHRTQQPQS